jgi:glutamyl-tRNA synthetase
VARGARQSHQARRCDALAAGGRREAAGKLPAEPWDEATWKLWTSSLGRKGRALFHPLRLALTAQETGPEMAKLLPLIGRVKAEARSRGEAA